MFCWSRTVWPEKKNVQKLSSCVTSWHKCSYCVIHWPVESFHHLNTSPKTSGTCFAASRRDTEHFQPSLVSCRFIAQYGLRQHNTVHSEQPRRPTFDRGGWLLRSGEWCSFAPGKVYFNPGEETPLIRSTPQTLKRGSQPPTVL